MTTNGVKFKQFAEKLKTIGLNSVNISLDSLKSERILQLTGQATFKHTMVSIIKAVDLGYESVKVNCVVIKGFNDDELCDFVELTRYLPIEVRFIEFMPFDGNNWEISKLFSYKKMLNIVQNSFPNLVRLNGNPFDVAKLFQVSGWLGRIGFITSMTENFCAGCSRLRLTSDGNLKICLHDNYEVSLVKVLRNTENLNIINEWINEMSNGNFSYCQQLNEIYDQLDQIVNQALTRKSASHKGAIQLASSTNRSMVRIGG
ncbi:GTP 3' protein [Schistosoma japonicum]|uniref:GTP 3' protein n=1 Tax=Schistosoma japonicum TaxID=6182 RepID=A0A4Z2CRM5_SCHJA|nr:GTP 3' protein [Schistosoma japonicum]